MTEQHLHIVAFDVPYPANYGGVIDIYYRMLNLAKAGVRIHLHCFTYGRGEAPELKDICHSVFYYSRDTSLKNLFKKKPYIVCSRNSKALKDRLLEDDYPILLEGLHCTSVLEDPRFEGRNIIVRTHNIEHEYYEQLSQQEYGFLKRKYLKSESGKLKNYENILSKATSIAAINRNDADYFLKKYPQTVLIPSNHKYDSVSSFLGMGRYIFYHANLSVPENYVAAEWLINNVFSKTDLPVRIAGKNPPKHLKNLVARHANIELQQNPSDEEMETLLRNAHIVVMYTNQATGLKLKLLNTLFSARFCLVNSKMVAGTGLESLCEIADTSEEMLQKIRSLSKIAFMESEIEKRELKLSDSYSNRLNVSRWIRLIEK